MILALCSSWLLGTALAFFLAERNVHLRHDRDDSLRMEWPRWKIALLCAFAWPIALAAWVVGICDVMVRWEERRR